MTDIPDELKELHRSLRAVHFRSRESFEPELLKRLQHGDAPRGSPSRWPMRGVLSAAIVILTAAAALSFRSLSPGETVSVDRCCYDLDGGGKADDGVLVLAERDSKVRRLRVYEDLDGSGSFGPGDIVRLDRGETPALHGTHVDGLVTTRRCCVDLDGGGPQDDGLLIIGAPPDQVIMAAIYETGADADPLHEGRWLLR